MFKIVLHLLGVACVLAGLIHAVFGAGGDWIIGVTPPTPIDPSLDSQNRFYGTIFIVYGILFWICSTDLRRYAPVLRALFGVMFLAGCARGLAVLHHGWPTVPIMVLWASELALPPLVWVWLQRELTKTGARDL